MQTDADFSFLTDEQSRNMIINAYYAVTRREAWDFLRTFEPEEGSGFMFTNNHIIKAIGNEMDTCPHGPPEHSGFSFSWTMRHMQGIAKKGFESWKKQLIENKTS